MSGFGLDLNFNPNYSLAPTNQTMNQGFQLPSFGSESKTGPASFQFGMNPESLQMGLSGLQSIGNLWGAFQSNKLAKDQLNFVKNMSNTNLNNSITSYNTALTDRSRARGFTEGQSQAEIDAYIAANRMTR